jgi:hypothetical protein
MMSDFYEFNQSREDDFERREERRFINELINDDPDFWRGSTGLRPERKPKTSASPAAEARRQPQKIRRRA